MLDVYKPAERAATSLLGLHANFMSRSRRLLNLEGMMTAANRSCKEGKSCDFCRPMLDVYKPAERAATSLLGLHANLMCSSSRLLILEGMMTAANRSCNEGKSGDFWAVASQVNALLHTLVAAFGVHLLLIR